MIVSVNDHRVMVKYSSTETAGITVRVHKKKAHHSSTLKKPKRFLFMSILYLCMNDR